MPTLKAYSIKAEEVLKTIPLKGIKVICADEIFEGQNPVMTVIDPKSTYVISMMLAADRSAETWHIVMEYAKDCGLNPERTISDAGKGLLCGIPLAFPEINLQIDVFHIMKDIGEACRNVINSFFSKLSELEEAYDQILDGKYRSKKAEKKCCELEKDIDRLYERAFVIETLNEWIKEMLGFTGYTAKEVLDTLLWIADELSASGVKRKTFHQKVKAFRRQAMTSVGYLEALEKNLDSLAESMGYRSETFRDLYRLSAMKTIHDDFIPMYGKLKRELKADYGKAMDLIRELVSSTYRASSIVENLNSRVRTYMNAKRRISGYFFPLLQLYINTKKYRRSEVPEREGKSPLELLTGEHRGFFELLGL